MHESIRSLHRLSRPRLLIRAARAGLAHYDRSRDLGRVLCGPVPGAPQGAIDRLLEEEAEIDDQRRRRDAIYDIGRHIELLVALMAEARPLAVTETAMQPEPAQGLAPVQAADPGR